MVLATTCFDVTFVIFTLKVSKVILLNILLCSIIYLAHVIFLALYYSTLVSPSENGQGWTPHSRRPLLVRSLIVTPCLTNPLGIQLVKNEVR